MDRTNSLPQPNEESKRETIARTVCSRCGIHGPWSSSEAAHIQLQMCLNCFGHNTNIEVTSLETPVQGL